MIILLILILSICTVLLFVMLGSQKVNFVVAGFLQAGVTPFLSVNESIKALTGTIIILPVYGH